MSYKFWIFQSNSPIDVSNNGNKSLVNILVDFYTSNPSVDFSYCGVVNRYDLYPKDVLLRCRNGWNAMKNFGSDHPPAAENEFRKGFLDLPEQADLSPNDLKLNLFFSTSENFEEYFHFDPFLNAVYFSIESWEEKQTKRIKQAPKGSTSTSSVAHAAIAAMQRMVADCE